MTAQILTQSRLQELVYYDPKTGKFIKKGKEPQSRNDGYLAISLLNKCYKAHRLAWFYVYGEWPAKGVIVDHINCNRNDNRIANLRLINHRENMQNKIRPQGKNPYLGVTQDKFSGKWRASIYFEGKSKGLGSSFLTAEEARDAYLVAKRIFHKGFAN